MARVFVVTNAKGGVLKSTLTSNLAYCSTMLSSERSPGLLSSFKKRTLQKEREEIPGRTLIIDLDAQGNQHQTFGLQEQETSVYDVLLKKKNLADCIVPLGDYLDLLPSNISMHFLNYDILTNKEKYGDYLALLANALNDDILSRYSQIWVDTPPSFDVATLTAMRLKNAELVIPVQPEPFAALGLKFLFDNVIPDMKEQNPTLSVAGIAVTLFDRRSKKVHADLLDTKLRPFAENYGVRLFETIITRSVKTPEAVYNSALPIVALDKKEETSKQFFNLYEELITNDKQK